MIPDSNIPAAAEPAFQHALDTYASETNKSIAVWHRFADTDLAFAPHPKSSTVEAILKHQLLSERRFFAEFLGVPEAPAASVLPAVSSIEVFIKRLEAAAQNRLTHLAQANREWWLEEVPFFDVRRQRAWIFWRRILHTAHHRTQLTVYLRLMERPVPAVYGPSKDETWEGADPTNTVDAAGRK